MVESRVGGADRYSTAAQVAQATFAAPNANIILASGVNFPDGLAAAGLAGAANAPVLLTDPATLTGVTQNAMGAIFGASPTKTVHIVGGESAVSANVAAQVTALGYTVNRISGANRYATAADIAAFQATLSPVGITFVAGAPLRTVFVATGETFPDALAAGAPAFRGKHPVLLTQSSALPAETAAALASLGAQRVILLGGESAVSADVATQIAAIGTGIRVDRISGADRGATAAALANVAVATAANGGFGFHAAAASAACLGTGVAGPNIALLLNGTGFADALAAGPHAGACGAPILLSGSASTSTFLMANTAKVGVVRAIGGTSAVPAADLTAAKTAATATTPTATLTVNQGSAVYSVAFSEAMGSATGSIKVNNGAELCGALVASTTVPAALVAGNCYVVTANGASTVWTLDAGGVRVVGDTVTATGFATPVTATAAARTAATATVTVPATVAPLTATIGGATVGAATATVTFNRPVTPGAAAASVTLVRATAPGVTVNVGPLTQPGIQAQTQTSATITIPAPALAAGDILTVTPAAATGVVATLPLTQNVSLVVPPAGGAPTITAATGVLTATGGVLVTTPGTVNTSLVIQADAARPANAINVTFTQAVTASAPTAATAVLNNTTGITAINVQLGTNAASAPNATPAAVAAALNAGAGSVVTATPSNPASTTVVPALAVTNIPAGTRQLVVTATASKPLTAVNGANIAYDGNADGFNDAVAAPVIVTTATPATPSNMFVATFTLGVGALPVTPGAAFTAGTSTIRLSPAAITDSTTLTNTPLIVAIAAP